MKLKKQFVTHITGDRQQMVDTTGNFKGLITGNATAAYIVELLKEETTTDRIVDAMCKKYNAPRNVIEQDVREILGKLQALGAIDE